MVKRIQPPTRPAPAKGVPTPVAWSGPSQSLTSMATSIGTNRALSEFYEALVKEQWEYDDDYRSLYNATEKARLSSQRLRTEHRYNIDEQDHREYLKGDKGSGLGNKSADSSVIKDNLKTTEVSKTSPTITGLSTLDDALNLARSKAKPESEEVIDPKIKASADKKAEEDEAEADWWHGVKNAITDNTPIDEVGSAIADSFVGDAAKSVAHSAVGKAAGDVGGWAIRQLSRSGHATAGAADAFFGMDDDPGSDLLNTLGLEKNGPLGGLATVAQMVMLGPLGPGVLGQSPSDSLDDINIEGIKSIGSGFWKGLKGEEHKTFSDVIGNNARRDPNENIFDSAGYRAAVGLGADMVLDPLNLVGVGLITKPIKTSMQSSKLAHTAQLAEDLASHGIRRMPEATTSAEKLAENAGTYTANEIVGMLTGKYTSKAQRIADSTRVRNNADYLSSQIQRGKALSTTSSRLDSIRATANDLITKRDAILRKHEADGLTEAVTTRLAAQEKAGVLPVGTADNFETKIHDTRISAAFKSAQGYIKNLPKEKPAAISLREARFNQAMGPEYMNHPLLTDADRSDAFNKAFGLEGIKNHPEPSISKVGHAQVEALRRQNRNRASKTLFEESKAVVAKNNAEIDRLRPLVFRQLIAAKIMKNQGKINYTDPERAAVLEQIVAKAQSELSSRNITPYELGTKREIEHDANFSGEEGSLTGTSRDLQSNPDEFAEPDLTDIDTAFAGDTRFHNYDSQLQAVYANSNSELKSLVSDYGPVEAKLEAVPYELLNPMSTKISKSKVAQYLTIDEGDKVLMRVREGVPDGPTRRWLEGFVQRANVVSRDYFNRLIRDESRRERESLENSITTRVTIDELRANAKASGARGDIARLAMKMFAPTDANKAKGIKGTDFADKHFAPFITVDEVKVTRRERAALSEHVTKADKDASARMKRYIIDPSKLNYAQKNWIVEQLAAHDISVVSTLKGVKKYLEKERSTLIESFSPEQAAFRRLFENEHGMTLSDAMKIRANVLGNVITSKSKKWTKAFPYGISKDEFVRVLTEAKNGPLVDTITDGFPGYIAVPETAEGFAKSPARYPFSGATGSNATNPGWRYIFNQSNEVVEKALKDVGLPTGSTIEDVRRVWLKDFRKYLANTEPEVVQKHLSKVWTDSLNKNKNATVTRRRRALDEAQVNTHKKIDYDAAREKARKYAAGEVVAQVDRGIDIERDLGHLTIPKTRPVQEVQQAVKDVYDEKEAGLKGDLKEARSVGSLEEVKAIEDRLEVIRKEWQIEKAAISVENAKAVESAKLLDKRLKEETILSVAHYTVVNGSKRLQMNVMGNVLDIPGTAQMFRAVEKAASVPVFSRFTNKYKNAFASQRKMLDEDLQVLTNRAISNPAEVISYHVKALKHTLGKVRMGERQAVMRGYVTGSDAGSDVVREMIDKQFTDLLPYFQGKVPVADTVLHLRDINAYLPEKFKFESKTLGGSKIDNPRLLAEELMANAKRNGHKGDLDPIEVIWNVRIAVEQSMAMKAFEHATGETFGIKRGYRINRKDGRPYKGQELNPSAETVEELRKYGWETIDGLGHKYYFPPESVHEIARMLDMFRPHSYMGATVAGKRIEPGRFIDEVTGMLKTTMTIYNPAGYYQRNGIGESMAAWIGGVHDARVFKRGNDVLRFLKHEGKEVEALRDHMPALKHAFTGETNSELGRKIVVRRPHQQLSAERVAVLYKDQGLSSGFINTEYRHHYSKRREQIRAIPGTKKIGQMNDTLREKNESFEDFFRMGHFIDKLQKAPANLTDVKAAEWAAREVRKYHFDYSDFSRFEKVWMLRAFPFYKWTRKALPLMSSMMFLKPGKMMVYPKAMTAASEYATGTDDLSGADQSFMPNYTGYVPSFVQDLWGYQVGENEFARIATPQMDAMRGLSGPTGLAYDLLNPLAKVPLEQLEGHTMGNMNFTLDDSGDRIDHVMRTVPLGSIAVNIKNGNFQKDDFIRALTGMGYYDTTPK